MILSPHKRYWLRLSYIGLSLILLATALAACQSSEQTDIYFAQDDSDLAADSDVIYQRLDNGLRYAVMQNATPSNTASLLMRVDSGSINEQDDERGLAHFLEHMAFNGSENLPEGEMIRRLEEFGLAFGPDTNASTDFTETIYQLELPDVSEELIDETLMIMRETASNLTLAEDAIERERGVILSEKRARNSPAYNASIASLSYYLQDSPFPNRIPIGTDETIQSVSAEQFRSFYRGYYRPVNTFIVLVGDFDADFAAQKIESYFGDWTAEGEPRPLFDAVPQGARDLEAVYYQDPEIQTSLAINVTSAPDDRKDTAANRKDYYIESLGNRILSRRLAKIAQTVDSPFISAGARTSTVYDTVRISSLNMSSEPEQWSAALKAGEQELRRAYLYGFTQAELDEQIANSRQSLEVAVQTSPTRRTSSMARRILNAFSYENVLTSPADNLELFTGYADDITPEDVHDAFKAQWRGFESPQIYLETSLEFDDPEAKILEALKSSQAEAVAAPEEQAAGEFAYTQFGPPGKVAQRGRIEDIGIETVQFENNVRLNIKKTPYEKGIIDISIAFGRGELALTPEQVGLRWFAPNIMSVGGLEAHSADEIRTLMAGKSVGTSFDMGTKRFFMSGATTPDDLPNQLNLMMAYMTAPGYRDEAKARYGKMISSFYPTLDSTAGGVASRDVSRIVRSGDPRFGIPSEDKLLGVPLEELEAWMTEDLATSAIEIGVVGDVDIERIIDEIGRTFGSLPERSGDLPDYPDAVTQLTFPQDRDEVIQLGHAGEADTALLQVYWPAPDGRDDMAVRRVNILRTMFRLELNDVLREKLGSTYSPSTFSFMSRNYPDFGYIGASVDVSPDNIETVDAEIRKIAARFAAGDVSEDVFNRAIKPVRESVEESLEDNGYWMRLVLRAQSDPERLERHRRRSGSYDDMTLEDVKAVGRQIFAVDDPLSIYILPES